MSEDFLKRWSRRKRDVAEAEREPADFAHESAAPTGDERSIEPVAAVEPPEPVFDLKKLPPIDSITAATDIRPFLAPGVPVDIARAALRRAWSVDRRIRDFVGLADYDFDYHAVGGAGGFGPLEMTDELRRAVARIVGEIADAGGEAPRERVVGAESTEKSRVFGADVEALPTALSQAPAQATPAAAPAFADTRVAVLQHERPQNELRRTTPRRGHGRALPK